HALELRRRDQADADPLSPARLSSASRAKATLEPACASHVSRAADSAPDLLCRLLAAWPSIPEEVDQILLGAARAERGARTAARFVSPPVVPFDGHGTAIARRALAAALSSAVREQPPRRLEVRAVPDLPERSAVQIRRSQVEPSEVVFAIERQAARRDAAVVVNHGLVPERAAACRPELHDERHLRVPVGPGSPAFGGCEVHPALACHLLGERDVFPVVGKDVKPPDEAGRPASEAALRVLHQLTIPE